MRAAELIQACYARLTAPAVVSLLSQEYGVPAVFQVGRVPRSESGDPLFFPYVTFSAASDADFSDKRDLGGNSIVQVDVWDRSGSAVTLGDIARQVQLATVRQQWAVPGFITCERDSTEIVADPDGLTMHAIVRLRVMYLDTGSPWSSEFSAEFG